jgi:hypothetical protein
MQTDVIYRAHLLRRRLGWPVVLPHRRMFPSHRALPHHVCFRCLIAFLNQSADPNPFSLFLGKSLTAVSPMRRKRPLAWGHAKLDSTALYTRVVNTTIRTVTSPLDRLALLPKGGREPECSRRPCAARGWRSQTSSIVRRRLAHDQCQACEPRSAQGDVSHRELPLSSSGRPCRALRGLRTQS